MIIAYATASERWIDCCISGERRIAGILRQPRLIVVFHVVGLRVENIEDIPHEVISTLGFPGPLGIIRDGRCGHGITSLVKYAGAEVSQSYARSVVRLVYGDPRCGNYVYRLWDIGPKVVGIVEEARIRCSDVRIEG